MADANTPDVKPPYVPWTTFLAFLAELKESTVPPRIDTSLFRGKSGSTQSELRGALRFFRLVEGEEQATTERLHRLVAASGDKDAARAELAKMLPEVYGEIVDGLDLERGTRQQLDEAFREKGGLVGSANLKAVRFFLSAVTAAGITVSPHFGAEKARASPAKRNGSGRTGRARQKRITLQDDDQETQKTDDATETIAVHVPGGRVIRIGFPAGLTKVEEDYVVAQLQGYFALKRQVEE